MKANATHTGLITAVLRKSGYSMQWSLHQVLEGNVLINATHTWRKCPGMVASVGSSSSLISAVKGEEEQQHCLLEITLVSREDLGLWCG